MTVIAEQTAAAQVSEREREIDRDLGNWANYVRGGLSPSVETMDFLQDEPRESIRIEDAEHMEAIMAQCKRERPDLWAYARTHYIAELTNREAARRLNLSRTVYKDRRSKLLAWVDGRRQKKLA